MQSRSAERNRKKFEIQRATVKNEKGQNYDNAPYGPFRELQAATLYPYGHPYSWLTIGKLEDLDRVDVDDLKKFFTKHFILRESIVKNLKPNFTRT